MKKFQESGDFTRYVEGGTTTRTGEKHFNITTTKSDARDPNEHRTEYRWHGTRTELGQLIDELNEIFWETPL